MASVPSANNEDPSLYCAYFGGPRDGLKTGDLPAELSGQPLMGSISKTPLSQPHQFSLFAVYECEGDAQVDGFWQFFYRGMEGPNGEQLVVAVDGALPHQLSDPTYALDGTRWRTREALERQVARPRSTVGGSRPIRGPPLPGSVVERDFSDRPP